MKLGEIERDSGNKNELINNAIRRNFDCFNDNSLSTNISLFFFTLHISCREWDQAIEVGQVFVLL